MKKAPIKFVIAVDCEGTAGVVGSPGKPLCASTDFSFAQEQATRETNAAARVLFNSGADHVLVWDTHGFGANLKYDKIDKRCQFVMGSGFTKRFPGVDVTYSNILRSHYDRLPRYGEYADSRLGPYIQQKQV